MNQKHLQKLTGMANAEDLHRAIEALCQPFGNPKNIYILPDMQRQAYVCFLALGSQNLNSSVIENLGGSYFANGVCFTIPFKQAND